MSSPCILPPFLFLSSFHHQQKYSFCERGGKFKEWTTWLCCGKLQEKHLAMK